MIKTINDHVFFFLFFKNRRLVFSLILFTNYHIIINRATHIISSHFSYIFKLEKTKYEFDRKSKLTTRKK